MRTVPSLTPALLVNRGISRLAVTGGGGDLKPAARDDTGQRGELRQVNVVVPGVVLLLPPFGRAGVHDQGELVAHRGPPSRLATRPATLAALPLSLPGFRRAGKPRAGLSCALWTRRTARQLPRPGSSSPAAPGSLARYWPGGCSPGRSPSAGPLPSTWASSSSRTSPRPRPTWPPIRGCAR